ncbi:MAG: Hpt domain-containing protein, partial [Cyanobacteria bacterium SBLK]|nr:Hpt domain-containing protein [Cyanobacteria bacterium SBLK]
MDAEQLKKITGYFISEAREHLEAIAQSLENFQAAVDDPEQIQEIYRGAHSIKGGAAMLELESIRLTAHRLEDYFKFLKSSPLTVDATLTDLISHVYNALQTLIDKLEETLSLPEEFAKTVMGKVEPLFDRISGHLEKLAIGKTAPGNHPTSSSLPQTLQVEVLNALAEIGQLQQQGDSPERRAHIQSLCRHLAKLEQSSARKEWTTFLEIAQTAIAYPKNNYQTTARYIVRDLKEAVAHLVAGEGREISPSRELLDLAQQVASLTPSDEISTTTAGELNDLADLFEEDSLNFAESWQEEVLDANALDTNGFINTEESPPIETDFADLFDTQTLGGSVDADPELKHELEDLFGGDLAVEETELIDSQSDGSTDSQGDRDLLALGTREHSKPGNPAADFDSLDNLFGEGFSFEEEENLANASEFTGESTEFSTAKTHREPASISKTLNDDLNKDLDEIFYDVDSNGDTERLLASESFALNVFEGTEEIATQNAISPAPQSEERMTESSEWEDMSDLLDISEASLRADADTDIDLEDFDPFETVVQNDVRDDVFETIASEPRANPDPEASADDEFNALLNGEDDGVEDMDDLEAFLSGQTTEMAFSDRPHAQPRKNNSQTRGAENIEIVPAIDEVLATPTTEAGDNVEITISSLDPAAEQDDDFMAFLEGDDNMSDRESEIKDLDALLENIPETAISESIPESSEEEFAALGLLPLEAEETSETALEDLELFSMNAGEPPVLEISREAELEDLFAADNEVLSPADSHAIDDLLGETSLPPTGDSPLEDDLAALLEIEASPADNEVLSPADSHVIDDLLGETSLP